MQKLRQKTATLAGFRPQTKGFQKRCLNTRNEYPERVTLPLELKACVLTILRLKTSICTHRHKSLMSKFLQKRPFQRFSRGQILIFQKWHWSLLKALPERFVSSLVSRTWVEIISEPKVSMCTHRHKIWNFEILVIFASPRYWWWEVEFYI